MQNNVGNDAYTVTGLLTHNQTIQAIATFCTLMAGAFLVWATAVKVWRFAKFAYRRSLQAAIREPLRLLKLQAARASRDLHYQIAAFTYWGALAALFGFIAVLIAALSSVYPPVVLPWVALILGMFAVEAIMLALILVLLAANVVWRTSKKRRRHMRLVRYAQQRA